MPVTGQGTPYVVATDVVGAYPEISRQLADAIDAKNTAQDNTAAGIRADVNFVAARTDGWMRNGTGMEYLPPTPNGSISIQTGDGNGTLIQNYASKSEFVHRRPNGSWEKWLEAYWATAGNNQMYVLSGAEWNLANPNNFFAGTFFPSLAATQQPADELPRAVQLPTDPDAPADTYDLSATVLALAAQVEALQARITELEAR